MEHGTEGPKMGLSGSFALPVLRTVLIRRGVELEGVIKSLTVRNLDFGGSLAAKG